MLFFPSKGDLRGFNFGSSWGKEGGVLNDRGYPLKGSRRGK